MFVSFYFIDNYLQGLVEVYGTLSRSQLFINYLRVFNHYLKLIQCHYCVLTSFLLRLTCVMQKYFLEQLSISFIQVVALQIPVALTTPLLLIILIRIGQLCTCSVWLQVFVYRKSNCIGLTDNNVPVAMLLDNAPHDNFKELIADQFIQVVIFVLIIFLSSNLRIYLLHQNVYVLECELFVDHLQSTDHKVGKYLPSN